MAKATPDIITNKNIAGGIMLISIFHKIKRNSNLLFLIFCLTMGFAYAKYPNEIIRPIYTNTDAGVNYNLIDKNLIITIDQDKALSAIPNLQSKGQIDKNISNNDLISMPVLLSTLVGGIFTKLIIESIFKYNSKVNQLYVRVFLKSSDDSGGKIIKFLYSFDLDRNLYNKISWDKFKPDDFLTQTFHIQLSSWYTEQFLKEMRLNPPGNIEK